MVNLFLRNFDRATPLAQTEQLPCTQLHHNSWIAKPTVWVKHTLNYIWKEFMHVSHLNLYHILGIMTNKLRLNIRIIHV